MNLQRVSFNFLLAAICYCFFVLSFFVAYDLLSVNGRSIFAQEVLTCSNLESEQKDQTSPYGDNIIPPEGFAISGVFITAGNICLGPYVVDGIYEDDLNGEESCYLIRGIGESAVNVVRVGNGDSEVCPDITEIGVIWEDDSPTGTPTPTPEISSNPTISVSPTPSIEVTVTPTVTESVPITPTTALSPTPTENPNTTPSPTLTPTPTDSVTSTPTPTPTGSVQGSSATSNGDSNQGTNNQGQVLGAATSLPSTSSGIGKYFTYISLFLEISLLWFLALRQVILHKR